VHLLSVTSAGGAVERVVLRRYVRGEDVIEEPDIAEREARALGLVAGLDLGAAVATPRLLAVDPTGASAGVPALLMSRIPARVEWFPRDVDRWLERLAGPLPGIHAAALPPAGVIRPFAPYRQERYEPPAWARWPRVWTRAIDLFHLPTPDDAGPAVFTHRDYHPGNVLWRRGRVTGVVDWASASIGPACVDVGHCRGNLFQYGLEVADRFTAIWEGMTGVDYQPWADVVTIIGSLDGLRDDPGPDRFLVEDALARAVALLGRSA
jgi:aminoglycoside phosphotransferase (APT) family kinase protein